MIETVVAVSVPVVSVGIWLLRLEGRINTHESTCAERQTRLDERHAVISQKLESIETKLDRLVESR